MPRTPEEQRAYDKKRYAANRERMCEHSRQYYHAHIEQERERSRRYAAAHPSESSQHPRPPKQTPEERRAKKRQYAQAHADKEKTRQYNQRLKNEILTHYGNGQCRCVICGESRIDCLSIDHLDNNGYDERKTRRRGGDSFYRLLKKQGFPPGYQTLCMNCNFIKAAEHRRAKFALHGEAGQKGVQT